MKNTLHVLYLVNFPLLLHFEIYISQTQEMRQCQVFSLSWTESCPVSNYSAVLNGCSCTFVQSLLQQLSENYCIFIFVFIGFKVQRSSMILSSH